MSSCLLPYFCGRGRLSLCGVCWEVYHEGSELVEEQIEIDSTLHVNAPTPLLSLPLAEGLAQVFRHLTLHVDRTLYGRCPQLRGCRGRRSCHRNTIVHCNSGRHNVPRHSSTPETSVCAVCRDLSSKVTRVDVVQRNRLDTHTTHVRSLQKEKGDPLLF